MPLVYPAPTATTRKKVLEITLSPDRSIQDRLPESLMVLFRIISRRSWDEHQSLHEAFLGSQVEYVLHGIYVLIIEPGCTRRLA
jgi:hypothetical protein